MQKIASTVLAFTFLLATACCFNMTAESAMGMPSDTIMAPAADQAVQHAGCHEVMTEDETEQMPPSCNIANAPESAFAGKTAPDFQLPTVSVAVTADVFVMLSSSTPPPSFARAPPIYHEHLEHKQTVVLRT